MPAPRLTISSSRSCWEAHTNRWGCPRSKTRSNPIKCERSKPTYYRALADRNRLCYSFADAQTCCSSEPQAANSEGCAARQRATRGSLSPHYSFGSQGEGIHLRQGGSGCRISSLSPGGCEIPAEGRAAHGTVAAHCRRRRGDPTSRRGGG